MTDPADLKDYARPRAEAAGVHWSTYERQIQAESRWEHWSSPGVVKSSPTGSKGAGQLNSRFYPESDWRDPYTNISKSIEIMSGYLKKFGSYRKALAAYNWGPGNVGGGTWDGVYHAPWDGRRETISDQGRHYLDVILGSAWEEPAATTVPDPNGTIFEDYRDPEPAGMFPAMPKGVILHGSRSGVAGNPKDKEYLGTARYEVNNSAGLGWHATVGEGRVALHLTAREWGWHALQASKVYLGVEFAQAVEGEPITDAQVSAFVDWFKREVLTVWPNLPMHMPSHAEADQEFNVNQGKTDAFRLGDPRMDDLRARIMRGLGSQQPQPGGTVTEAEAAALRAENARLQETINGLVTAVAVLGDDVGDAIAAQVTKMRSIREQFVGPRPK